MPFLIPIIQELITSDFEKINAQFQELLAELAQTISDPAGLEKAALKQISEKYPPKRGYNLIAERIDAILLSSTQ